MNLALNIIGLILALIFIGMYILAIWGIIKCYHNDGVLEEDDPDASDRLTRSSKRRKASSRSRIESGSSL